jgi:tRNA nucleotidyltransferase (CCA-adding enzyme)
VEDYTGRGLSDLASKVARTPLPPKQTFEDDPLRVLRCIRFASRFDLSVAEEVTDAIKLPEIQVRSPTESSLIRSHRFATKYQRSE